ncbi:ATP-dependent (S)-NAD(P)H-hydrate dehydratase [Anatilimnocola aggregata]|uniref:ADP-dependent (S)-NAD(P)H-hydrate dehydratase n=1 Tax=Anatilimnocola aggregata TaxID=2528021 RepID=A0A517YB00_9BACT|nr:NAD(P)H-hydrate dehydratase [Anatilimnocola aggregata]QDU27374.1 ATP-dependent (S)-NAD(P)H-hydrate dehydratase [Anatilimnocola aggregata]
MPLPHLPPRKPDSHKGNFGRAVLIGGSYGMAGAISLSGMACLRSGAGLVQLAVAEPMLAQVACHDPCYMTTPLSCHDDAEFAIPEVIDELQKVTEPATCLAIGPGLGRSEVRTKIVQHLYERLPQPLVVDADGLNALADVAQRNGQPPRHPGPRILTPHPGEFSRLTNQKFASRAEQVVAAKTFAAQWNVVLVLKGQHTLITDGIRHELNQTGNPGMATGGSGDVLTGVITALVCQGLAPFEAAVLGCHVHGLAGDLAATEVGQVSLIATDLVRFLPPAFQRLEG